MKRVYFHYTKWEDWQNGMFALEVSDFDAMKQSGIELLKDLNELENTMSFVSKNWPCSTRMNLGNRSRNRQAWLGQAALCYKHKIPEWLTREIWGELTDDERIAANEIADKIIKSWEIENNA